MAATRKTETPAPLFALPPSGRSLSMVSADRHDCVVALKALGEDTRVRIVGLLLDQPMEVGTIAERLGVSQYNVSKHLRILREAGLLQAEKDGRRHLYALADSVRSDSAATGVLDLGCCSFQFDEAPPARRSPADKPRQRARRPSARKVR